MAGSWKEGVARLARRWPFSGLMVLGVRLAVPRQRVGVALVAFNSKEEVLLLRHVFYAVTPWGLPGGWLGRNEAPVDGLARELREETGRAAVIGPPIHVAYETRPPHLILAYLGWLQPGSMRFNAEILEARWFAVDEARWFAVDEMPRPLWPFTERAIAIGLETFRLTTHSVPAVAGARIIAPSANGEVII
jgi:ADP-ribose pyrophosphatase YjhB (NUDIX family)